MTETYYAQLDNLILEETNVKTLQRYIAHGDDKELILCLNKGDSKYYFTFDGENISNTTENKFRENGLILQILKKAYDNKS